MDCVRPLITGLSLLLVVGAVSSASTSGGPYCAVCDDETGIEDCKSFIHCSHNQRCFLQVFKHNHGLRYYGGCAGIDTCSNRSKFPHKRDSHLITNHNRSPHQDEHNFQCGGCCDEDECNLHLCGTPKSTVVACALCNGEDSIRDCQHLVECPDQECFLQVYSNISHTHPDRQKLYGGCATSKECQSHHLGARNIFKDNKDLQDHNYNLKCASCCRNGTICNVELCDQKKHFHLPTHPTTRPTPAITTMHNTQHVAQTTQEQVYTNANTQTDSTTTQRLSTTGSTTIITAESSTSSSTTTTTTTTMEMKKIQCHQCSGPLCGVVADGPAKECPIPDTFCLSKIVNDAAGKKTVAKGCASEITCNTKWWEDAVCLSFHPTTNYTFPFTCSYCCTSPKCNSHLFPDIPNLYAGPSLSPLLG